MSRIFLFFCIFFISTASLHAEEKNNYLIENVAVNVSAKSPNIARTSAIASARRDAFLILLTRLEMNVNLADNISDEEIAYMVRSEQIDGEKIAGNNYRATFNIMFAKDFVDHVLAEKNPQNLPQKKLETYLLIPAKILKNKKIILWENDAGEDNDWKKALEKNLAKISTQSATKKLIMLENDLENVAIINRENVANIDYSDIEPVLLKQKSDAAYSLIFFYDEIENKAVINLSYIRKLQKKQVKLSFVNVDRLSYEDLLDKVATKTIEYLFNAENNAEKILSSNLIHLAIPISTIGNYLTIKNKIESSNLVNQLNIESISRDEAVIALNYINGKTDVISAFAQIGLSLTKKSENFYHVIND